MPPKSSRFSKSKSKVAAIGIAIAFHVVLLLLLTLFVILPAAKETPEVVASIVAPSQAPKEQRKKVETATSMQVRQPASASNPLRANTLAEVSIAKAEISEAPVGLGEVQLTSGQFSSELSRGTASFFGMPASGQRFAYCVDFSGSMRQNDRERKMKQELRRSIENLPDGAKFEVICFAGPAWVAGKHKSVMLQGMNTMPPTWRKVDGKGFEPINGEMPAASWRSSPSDVRRTIKDVMETPLAYGTDWLPALKVAYALDPKPDVIFLMTDGGLTAKNDAELKSYTAEMAKLHPGTVVNAISFGSAKATATMKRIAETTGGEFSFVDPTKQDLQQ